MPSTLTSLQRQKASQSLYSLAQRNPGMKLHSARSSHDSVLAQQDVLKSHYELPQAWVPTSASRSFCHATLTLWANMVELMSTIWPLPSSRPSLASILSPPSSAAPGRLPPLREIADDLHPGRARRDLGPDGRGELFRLDRGVHAGKVPVRRGEEAAGGGHHRAPGRRGAREAECDLAAAAGVTDHGHPRWRRTRRRPGTARARRWRRFGCACASTNPARENRPGSSSGSPVPATARASAAPSRNVPEKVHAMEAPYKTAERAAAAEGSPAARQVNGRRRSLGQ